MSMIKVEDLTFSYPASHDRIFDSVSFQIDTNWKLGFVGRNGRGKTTFLQLLMGNYPYQGTIVSSVPFDYFPYPVADQTQWTQDVLQSVCPQAQSWELLRELSYLDVDPEVLFRPFATLSKGEQTKVLLAALFLKEGHFLLIDEPTNHLDMQTREALTMALSSFEGSVLLVSHDRHLLAATTERLMLVHEGKVSEFDGDLDDYAKLVLETRKASLSAEKAKSETTSSSPNKREARQQAALERQRIANLKKPLQKELAQVEKKLEPLSSELKALDAKLADSDFYTQGDQDEVAAALKRRGELSVEVEALEARWLELSEAIEAVV